MNNKNYLAKICLGMTTLGLGYYLAMDNSVLATDTVDKFSVEKKAEEKTAESEQISKELVQDIKPVQTREARNFKVRDDIEVEDQKQEEVKGEKLPINFIEDAKRSEVTDYREEKQVKDGFDERTVKKRPLTHEDAVKIAEGKLTPLSGKLDTLLYKKPVLNLFADDDKDGILNKDELYIFEKKGKEYYGYYSHPRLEDSDGDGLTDKQDDNSKEWYVTDRDTVMLAELSYREDDYIRTVLDATKPLTDVYKGRNEYKMIHNELAPFWVLKRTFHFASGLDAVLFENVSKFAHLNEKSGVNVLAIRGTKEFSDFMNDVAITFGDNPKQAIDVKRLAYEIANDKSINKLYVAGHSLGGYLTQRLAVELYQNYNSFYNEKFRKGTTFNAPKINVADTPWNKEYGLWQASLDARKLSLEGKLKHYGVENDYLVGLIYNDNDVMTYVGKSEGGHSSRTYFEARLNTDPDVKDYFNIGKRDGIDGVGYRDKKISELLGFTLVRPNRPEVSKPIQEPKEELEMLQKGLILTGKNHAPIVTRKKAQAQRAPKKVEQKPYRRPVRR